MTPIESILEPGRPLVLDGGLGSELASRGHELTSSLWSAELIVSQPQAIVDVHRAYLDAGARCVISASYQASVPGLEAAGFDLAAIKRVFTDAIALAQTARDEFLHDNPQCGYRPLIAASIGPYGAYLADGSEYRGNYGVSEASLHDFHEPRLRWLDAGGADLLACETLPDLQEAKVLSELLATATTPAWVSFCCADDERLHDGHRLEDAVALFDRLDAVIAIGVNCVAPEHVGALVSRLRDIAGERRIVVYPNSGAQYDAGRKRWHGQETAQQWARQANAWYAAGADLIGGCCRIGPEHIEQLAKSESWHC